MSELENLEQIKNQICFEMIEANGKDLQELEYDLEEIEEQIQAVKEKSNG